MVLLMSVYVLLAMRFFSWNAVLHPACPCHTLTGFTPQRLGSKKGFNRHADTSLKVIGKKQSKDTEDKAAKPVEGQDKYATAKTKTGAWIQNGWRQWDIGANNQGWRNSLQRREFRTGSDKDQRKTEHQQAKLEQHGNNIARSSVLASK